MKFLLKHAYEQRVILDRQQEAEIQELYKELIEVVEREIQQLYEAQRGSRFLEDRVRRIKPCRVPKIPVLCFLFPQC